MWHHKTNADMKHCWRAGAAPGGDLERCLAGGTKNRKETQTTQRAKKNIFKHDSRKTSSSVNQSELMSSAASWSLTYYYWMSYCNTRCSSNACYLRLELKCLHSLLLFGHLVKSSVRLRWFQGLCRHESCRSKSDFMLMWRLKKQNIPKKTKTEFF